MQQQIQMTKSEFKKQNSNEVIFFTDFIMILILKLDDTMFQC